MELKKIELDKEQKRKLAVGIQLIIVAGYFIHNIKKEYSVHLDSMKKISEEEVEQQKKLLKIIYKGQQKKLKQIQKNELKLLKEN